MLVDNNMAIYSKVKHVPENAIKSIQGGRLKGFSDINAMWRVKTLTEQFGPCGVGWRYTIDRRWMETAQSGEVAAFVEISMYIRYNGEWSEAIPGTGGSSFITKEKNGLYVSDECFKMALTDAISVSCKALGIGADVYWEKDATKYSNQDNAAGTKPPHNTKQPSGITSDQSKELLALAGGDVTELIKALNLIGYPGDKPSKAIKAADYETARARVAVHFSLADHGQNVELKDLETISGPLPWEKDDEKGERNGLDAGTQQHIDTAGSSGIQP